MRDDLMSFAVLLRIYVYNLTQHFLQKNADVVVDKLTTTAFFYFNMTMMFYPLT